MEKKDFININICFLILLLFHLRHSASRKQPLCHEHESSALLKFKQSFLISKAASNSDAYPKVRSWNFRSGGGRDCCDWDGVECHKTTGYVISLDISNSCLYGPINSSSSLFQLVHLQRLNLALNNFNYSEIPSAIWRLSRLTHLNLSYSSFSGQIPPQVLHLTKLESLELCGNPATMLQNPGLKALVANLAFLQQLHLNYVNISSTLPDVLANLSSLTSIYLEGCSLQGEFPRSIFYLPNLRNLSVRFNPHLTGLFPEVKPGSRLQLLGLASTGFTGKLPASIENLNSLTALDISNCSFSGFIPASMANLTKLTHLSLSNNKFYSQTLPSWLGKLTQLTVLRLDALEFKGDIPSSLANLTQLYYMCFRTNQLTGRIPLWLGNLTRLNYLDFTQNKLEGQIPDSIFQLSNLKYIYLHGNNLHGVLGLDKFLNLQSLTHLDLSTNKFSVLPDINTSETVFPKMKMVGLGSCNLSKFPNFLRGQTELEWLDLSANNIHGQIPRWIWNLSTETLMVLRLDFNFLTGFEEQPLLLPWKRLQILSLIANRLQGSLPIPPPSTYIYHVKNNSFTGNLPPELCRLTLLYLLDVSDNNLSGIISPCFGNFSNNLVRLNLRGNKFHGLIPQTFQNGGQLRDINFSQNKLRGRLPRSLGNCSMLEILDVSDNQINDSFPHWLGSLPNLKIVNLRANQFHGVVNGFKNGEGFSKLRIIDASHNSFFGQLPAEYFQNWNAMKTSNRRNATYLVTSFNLESLGLEYDISYITGMTIKGVEMENQDILDTLAVIDFSSNRFDGAIPKATAILKGLHLLNLSRNYLTGPVPPLLSNLTELESLDLSHNYLSGQIPVELAGLTSLEIFDVSYNKLSGLIPHGNQFDTFQNSTYLGNLKLCGSPLWQQCHKIQRTPPSQTMEKDADEESITTFDWVVISMGYACGLVIGIMIGCVLTARKHKWFAETFAKERRQQIPRRRRR